MTADRPRLATLRARVAAWARGEFTIPPRGANLLPWTISLASLALGLATLFVFRRGLPHVSWIVGYLLLLSLAMTVVAELRAPLEAHGRRLVAGAGEYLLQTLCHGLFLFVLPSYYSAATLTSSNALLVWLLAAAALLTTIDPWFRALVHPRPWLRCAVLGLAMFAGLNVALALLGIRPIAAAVGGAGLAGAALTPALRRPESLGWLKAAGRAMVIAAGAMAAVWLYPMWVPPAPLFVARAVAARDVVDLEPVDVIDTRVDSATVRGWGSLATYTAVYAPAGIQQPIEHIWRRDGALVAGIPLAITGGRREGFRTFSRRRLLEPVVGDYRVDVMTSSGQLIGRVAFTVTP